jgi:hypothetical protein
MTFNFSKWMGKYGDVVPMRVSNTRTVREIGTKRRIIASVPSLPNFNNVAISFVMSCGKSESGRREVGLTTILRRTASLQ